MIDFDYACDACGRASTSSGMETMLCECGGNMRLISASQIKVFKPFYSNECKTFIRSYGQMHKEYKKNGLVPFDDVPGIKKKMSDIRKNKEYIKKERYAKEGLKYKPGSNVRFDDKNKQFITPHEQAKEKQAV